MKKKIWALGLVWLLLLGAAAQLGIFLTFFMALASGQFTPAISA